MVEFEKNENDIIAIFSSRRDNSYVYEIIENEDRDYGINKAFYFKKEHLITSKAEWDAELKKMQEIPSFEEEFPDIRFKFASKYDENYFKVHKGILTDNFDVYLDKDEDFEIEFFLFQDTPFFKAIEDLILEDVYFGGDHPIALPIGELQNLITSLPTQHEIKLYKNARASTLLREYFSTTKDADVKFEKYRNKKVSKKGKNLSKTFSEYEIEKYNTIYEKLKTMLDDEEDYSEHQWQDEILQIILLLYPKYISVFKSVKIRASIKGDIRQDRQIDLMLVDASGNIDIVEIKKPFEKAIMSNREHRNNYIPLKELSGSIMQLEKYIYYLNRWSEAGEKELLTKYKDDLPEGFDLKITNPNGLIIMGRENNLSKEQKSDFEVVKRKYKNVADIITYDNLLERLKFTIERLKKV